MAAGGWAWGQLSGASGATAAGGALAEHATSSEAESNETASEERLRMMMTS
jgi:hypothetical protein